MAWQAKVITIQKDLHSPESSVLDCMTMKRNKIVDAYPLHIHDHYEMELVIEGRGTHWINGQSTPLSPGSLYLLSPADMHRFVSDGTMRLETLHIISEQMNAESQALLRCARGGAVMQLSPVDYEEIGVYLAHMRRLISERAPFVRESVTAFINLIVAKLLREGQTYTPLPQNQSTLGHFRRALEYLGVHYTQEIRLKDVADYSGLSECYFSAMFTQYVGCSFQQYLIRQRTQHAKHLLGTTDTPVTEVAFQSGFGSLSNFLRTFRNQTGCTPSEYRRKR